MSDQTPNERMEQIKAQLAAEWRQKAEYGIHHDHLSDLAFLIVQVEHGQAEHEKEVATLTAWCEALEIQARDISVTLSDAGVNAMPIPEGVRSLIAKKDAEIARIEREKAAYRTLAELDKASIADLTSAVDELKTGVKGQNVYMKKQDARCTALEAEPTVSIQTIHNADGRVWETTSDVVFTQVLVSKDDDMTMDGAPAWMRGDEAQAWASGYNSGVATLTARCEALEQEVDRQKALMLQQTLLGTEFWNEKEAAELRCEALTAERDRQAAEVEEWKLDYAIAVASRDAEIARLGGKPGEVGGGTGEGDAPDRPDRQTYMQADSTTVDALRSRCQHLEQAVKDYMGVVGPWNTWDPVEVSTGWVEGLKTAEAAIASLLHGQEEPTQTDENRVSFAAGYSQALDDQAKGLK
jgi:hypothetical protein